MTDSGFKGLLETVFGYLQHWVPARLSNGVCDTPLDGALDLMSTIVDVCAQDVKQLATVMPDVFVVAFVFPTFCDADDNPQAAAIEVWRKWEGLGDPERHRVVLDSIKEKLCAFMADCHIKPTYVSSSGIFHLLIASLVLEISSVLRWNGDLRTAMIQYSTSFHPVGNWMKCWMSFLRIQ